MKAAKPYWQIIGLLAFIKFILPFILQSPVFELQRDEYLYYEQGRHFDLGYLENPPLLSWLGMVSSWLGGSVFWIRFWPSLLGGLTLIFTCLLAAEFGGKRFAQFIAGLCIITGAYMRMHSLFQPNVLDIFCWVLSIYFLVRFINQKDPKFILALVLSLVAGWWSKYSILFLAVAMLIAIIGSKYRRLFVHKKTVMAITLGLLLVLPNIWWQYQHNWPLIHHMKELKETQLHFISPLDFIKDQFLYLVPVIFVWITGLVWLFRKKEWRFLGLIYCLVIALLILGSGKSYYAMGIYPLLLAAGAVALEKWSFPRQWARYAMILLIFILTVPFIPMLLPLWKPEKLADFYKKTGIAKTGMLKWEDQQDHSLPQDFADMLGWKELTVKTEKFFQRLSPVEQSNLAIFCRHYGQAGALKFYGKDPYFTGKVFTDNGSFLLWISDRPWFKHLIFIGRRLPGPDDEVFQHFQKVTIIDSVTDHYSRQFGDKIIFYREIDSAGMRIAGEGLREMKNEFKR